MTTEDTSPENLRKFLESDNPAMVRKILGDEKAISVLAQMIECGGDEEVRGCAVEELVDIGGSKARNLLMAEIKNTPHDEWWIRQHIIEGLGEVGNDETLHLLDGIFDDEHDKLREFYMENPNSTDGPNYRSNDYSCLCYESARAIAKIGGNKGQEILLSYVTRNEPWLSSNVAIGFLKNEWEPKNEKERISELIAEHNWEGCKKMGDRATVEAIASIVVAIYYYERSVCVSGEIVEAINSFGKEKFISIIEEEGFGEIEFGSTEETIESIELMIDNY